MNRRLYTCADCKKEFDYELSPQWVRSSPSKVSGALVQFLCPACGQESARRAAAEKGGASS